MTCLKAANFTATFGSKDGMSAIHVRTARVRSVDEALIESPSAERFEASHVPGVPVVVPIPQVGGRLPRQVAVGYQRHVGVLRFDGCIELQVGLHVVWLSTILRSCKHRSSHPHPFWKPTLQPLSRRIVLAFKLIADQTEKIVH